MTNSRLTDPEVLEMRFPVLLERFALRPGSGGQGGLGPAGGRDRALPAVPGPDGLRDSCPRIAQRPRGGIAGGGDGQVGKTEVRRKDGTGRTAARLRTRTVLEPGEAVIVTDADAGGLRGGLRRDQRRRVRIRNLHRGVQPIFGLIAFDFWESLAAAM